jgi:glycosyltransferase involved in cell wall biosynthesis
VAGSLGAFPGGRAGRVVWEQVGLPVAARHAEAVLNLGNLAPLASRKNLVLTYDLHMARFPEHYRTVWSAPYWRIAREAFRRARFRVTLSHTMARELEAALDAPVDAVLPPGVDAVFRPASAERVEAVRRRLRLEGPYLLVVGWAQAGKRADLAVEAHRRVVRDVPHQCVLVGSRHVAFAPVGMGPLPASVVMAGRLSDRDLAALYAGSAGLLFPTLYEGFGLPPVEALACGAPVAATRLPVMEEVLGGLPGVRQVEAGDAAAWAEAAAWLLEQEGSRNDRSRSVLERYPWAGKGRTLLDLVRGTSPGKMPAPRSTWR